MPLTQLSNRQLKDKDLTGASFNDGFKLYDETKNYLKDDIVIWDTSIYIALANTTGSSEGDLTSTPENNNLLWKKIGFEVLTTGEIIAPELTKVIISDSINDRILVTREYVETEVSQLEKITENGNTGLRLLGSDPANYADIGDGAVDLSRSTTASTTYGATGIYSFAEGRFTEASGNYGSHAEGFRTIASGNQGHAEGNNTTASGIYGSHSEGFRTTASGRYGSHSEGNYTTASGDYGAHAEGNYTIANNDGMHAEGMFNVDVQPPTLISVTGIGADEINRANGFEIHTTGEVIAPELTKVIISDSINDRILVTREYVETEVSQLEKITENGNTGWRLLGSDPANYGNIGDNAIDLSISTTASATLGATGNYSFTQGLGTVASGQYSHAEGYYTKADDNGSHAEGYHTTASGQYSHAEGYYTKADDKGSHAEGYYTIASGIYGSHAEGDHATASSYASHAEGKDTAASGQYSHAEGSGTTASGIASHAEGYNAKANGQQGSHAEGFTTTASGFASHAEGNTTIASGNYSHAEGKNTTTIGINGAHAEGLYTVANNEAMHAEGKYNIETQPSTLISVTGIGTSTTIRKNGFEIHTTGEVIAPELTNSIIDNSSSNRVLATKEWVRDVVDNKVYTVSTTETIPTGFDIIIISGITGDITISLPSTYEGDALIIKRLDTAPNAFIVTIDTPIDLIPNTAVSNLDSLRLIYANSSWIKV